NGCATQSISRFIRVSTSRCLCQGRLRNVAPSAPASWPRPPSDLQRACVLTFQALSRVFHMLKFSMYMHTRRSYYGDLR
ncbi:hypothetical protein HAX54_027087, partial [Datura stramonium]|nr:hypothetical protein [Datura stramonium]